MSGNKSKESKRKKDPTERVEGSRVSKPNRTDKEKELRKMFPKYDVNYVRSPILGDKPGRDLYMHDYPVGGSSVHHRGRDEWTSHKSGRMNEKAEKTLNKQLDGGNL